MHLGIIMDGNRRWAKKHCLQTFFGHKTGIDILENVLDWCMKYKIDVLSVYALSTENLQREKKELDNLFDLIRDFALKKNKFIQKNIKVKLLGNTDLIREDALNALIKLEEATKDCSKILFQPCIAYGGRDEIIRSIHKIQEKKLDINEENIFKYLDSNLCPDLIIRTGGHKRLSNFLIWQSAYSELLFLEKMWPEFSEQDLKKAIIDFNLIQKNYGK